MVGQKIHGESGEWPGKWPHFVYSGSSTFCKMPPNQNKNTKGTPKMSQKQLPQGANINVFFSTYFIEY